MLNSAQMQAVGPAPQVSEAALPELKPAPQRYLALDAFRGFIMVMLASGAFGFGALKNDPTWGRIAQWFDHVPWEGGVFWDMIQPCFMFMVGVAMPFALAKRTAGGATFRDNFRHVSARSLRLILWSQVLICIGAGVLKFQLVNVLCQIALTYFLCFLIMQMSRRKQVAAAVALLAGHWLLYQLFPGPGGPYSRTDSIGVVIDRWWLGYDYDPAYSTLNFVTSAIWTLAGIWTGRLLMTRRSHTEKLKWLAGGMALSFALGLGLSPWIPMIKQISTASFVLYSLGWALAMLIAFYWVVEVKGYRKFTFPLLVVGANSIFIYSLEMVLREWLNRAVGVFTGNYHWIGTLAPVAQSCTVLLLMWYACYWLYKHKIFFRL
jgi:heparan-alpha-glucosaminide N-acetyltransferase